MASIPVPTILPPHLALAGLGAPSAPSSAGVIAGRNQDYSNLFASQLGPQAGPAGGSPAGGQQPQWATRPRNRTRAFADPAYYNMARDIQVDAHRGFAGAMQGAMSQLANTLQGNAERVNKTRRLEMILNSPLLKSLMGGGGGIRGFETPHGQTAYNPG